MCVECTEQPGVVLDVDSERRFVLVGFRHGFEAVGIRPGSPERLVALRVLVRHVQGLGVLEDKTVETDFEDPPDERFPILVHAGMKGNEFRSATGVGVRMLEAYRCR